MGKRPSEMSIEGLKALPSKKNMDDSGEIDWKYSCPNGEGGNLVVVEHPLGGEARIRLQGDEWRLRITGEEVPERPHESLEDAIWYAQRILADRP